MSHAAPFMIALALVAGIAVQLVARTLRVPAIILLLGAGVALGPVGVDWIDPRLLGDALFAVVDFAVAVILFEGALNLRINRLRREERVIRRLITLGALVTLVGGALASWLRVTQSRCAPRRSRSQRRGCRHRRSRRSCRG